MKFSHLINRVDVSHISIILLLAIFALISCSTHHESEPKETILARVGDKTISVNEFIRRAEFTIRPAYCNLDFGHDKMIILNSLIAEKLVAIEAGDTNKFITNDTVQARIRGIKEQAMRKWQYKQEGLDKVSLDSAQLKEAFASAGRKYNIGYITFPDSASATKMKAEILANNRSFGEVSNAVMGLDTIPTRQIEFSFFEPISVLDSLYLKPRRKGTVVGPLNINGTQTLLRVDGWTNTPALSTIQQERRWNKVTEAYTKLMAKEHYNDYVYKVMQGKAIEFHPDAFYQVAEILAPIYDADNQKRRQQRLMRSLFKDNVELSRAQDTQGHLKSLYQRPLFTVDGNTWTVRDFAEALIAHPLVFRQTEIDKNHFAHDLKFAIIDLVEDHYLTEEAYKQGLDKVNVVQRHAGMWEDHLNFNYYRTQLLRKLGVDTLSNLEKTDYPMVIEKYLNEYVNSLQAKYSDTIEVNVDAFNEINLTKIDMIVLERNVPYPQVVPPFPLVTTDHRLDYGRRMAHEGHVRSAATSNNKQARLNNPGGESGADGGI